MNCFSFLFPRQLPLVHLSAVSEQHSGEHADAHPGCQRGSPRAGTGPEPVVGHRPRRQFTVKRTSVGSRRASQLISLLCWSPEADGEKTVCHKARLFQEELSVVFINAYGVHSRLMSWNILISVTGQFKPDSLAVTVHSRVVRLETFCGSCQRWCRWQICQICSVTRLYLLYSFLYAHIAKATNI